MSQVLTEIAGIFVGGIAHFRSSWFLYLLFLSLVAVLSELFVTVCGSRFSYDSALYFYFIPIQHGFARSYVK